MAGEEGLQTKSDEPVPDGLIQADRDGLQDP
jgi:hypothetical protein